MRFINGKIKWLLGILVVGFVCYWGMVAYIANKTIQYKPMRSHISANQLQGIWEYDLQGNNLRAKTVRFTTQFGYNNPYNDYEVLIKYCDVFGSNTREQSELYVPVRMDMVLSSTNSQITKDYGYTKLGNFEYLDGDFDRFVRISEVLLPEECRISIKGITLGMLKSFVDRKFGTGTLTYDQNGIKSYFYKNAGLGVSYYRNNAITIMTLPGYDGPVTIKVGEREISSDADIITRDMTLGLPVKYNGHEYYPASSLSSECITFRETSYKDQIVMVVPSAGY